MKLKLLPFLIFLLVIMNGILIFMLVKNPHKRPHGPEKNFIVAQLQFTENQKENFRDLDKVHRGLMQSFDEKIRKNKNILFNSFSKENFNAAAITREIGFLSASKEAELFRFFSEVRKTCTQEQVKKFDLILQKALILGDKHRPREGGEHHPPR